MQEKKKRVAEKSPLRAFGGSILKEKS